MHNVDLPTDNNILMDDGDGNWEPVPQALGDHEAFSAAVRETIEHRLDIICLVCSVVLIHLELVHTHVNTETLGLGASALFGSSPTGPLFFHLQ